MLNEKLNMFLYLIIFINLLLAFNLTFNIYNLTLEELGIQGLL